MKSLHIIIFGVALIGAALFSIRLISGAFYVGTTTADHPYALFAGLMVASGLVWLGLIPLIRNTLAHATNSIRVKPLIWAILVAAIAMRALFFGSTPIYEDDWNRYLWDGAVITEGINPYSYAPAEIVSGTDNVEIERLAAISKVHNGFTEGINNPELKTIYPPGAQMVFTIAAFVKPLDLNALRAVYLLIEIMTLLLLIKALPLYGRSPLWAALYAFNPLLIYTGFNAAHMDILIVPFFILMLIFVGKKPYATAIALAGAAAVKLWPLLLAPVVFRSWRKHPGIYIGVALLIAALSALAFMPLLLSLGANSGLSAYSTGWLRSSFLFPWIETTLGFMFDAPGGPARIFIATFVTVLALYLGLKRGRSPADNVPLGCLIVTLALLFLSPTGYPWYAIWMFAFLPFIPSYGAGLLTVLVPLYYIRYALGESGHYAVYTNWVVPFQFGLPLIVLAIEAIRRPRHA